MTSEPVAPYHNLASIYDYVMRHVEYDDWAAYLHALFERFNHRPSAVIDLACGTGNIAFALTERDYPVTCGVDGSASMIEVARQKAAGSGYSIDFAQRDLRQLKDLGTFDTAVCIYDSVNYLLTQEAFGQALAAIHGLLRPGGLFVFDVCTECNSRRYFSRLHEQESGPGFTYSRDSSYDAANRLQLNHFTICFTDRKSPIEEHHVQRIYPLAELCAAVEASDFELLDAFDGFTFAPGSEQSERLHFALRRPVA